MKYDFSIINNGSNDIFTNTLNEVSNATNNTLGLSFIIVIATITFYVFMRRTQDIGKSFVTTLHISTIFSILLYYYGLYAGFTLVNEYIILLLVVMDILAISFIVYNRRDQAWNGYKHL